MALALQNSAQRDTELLLGQQRHKKTNRQILKLINQGEKLKVQVYQKADNILLFEKLN